MAAKQICRQCKTVNPAEARFCFSCGTSLAPPIPFDGLLAADTILRNTYVIEDVLGEGGMGVVYKAHHHTLGSHFAIKVLDAKLARVGSLRERFLEEARIQATLSHPNIVRVHDVLDEEGVFGMVMEHIEGRTLDVYVHDEKGQVDLNEAVNITVAILDAIGHAHKAGVVHRDLKPSNIMLLDGHDPDDIGSALKVMDFGIAKVLDADGGRTVTGAKMGTPRYMAPEQVKNARKVDARADLYAIGLTLYELVTGCNPYEELRDYDLLQAQVNKPPPPPSQFRKGLPPELEKVILHALVKDPKKRIPSAETFIDNLQSIGPWPTGTSPTVAPLPHPEDQQTPGKPKKPAAKPKKPAAKAKGPAPRATGASPRPSATDGGHDSDAEFDDSVPEDSMPAKDHSNEWSMGETSIPESFVESAVEEEEDEDPNDSWAGDSVYEEAEEGSRSWMWIVGIIAVLGLIAVGYRFLVADTQTGPKHEPLTEEQTRGEDVENLSSTRDTPEAVSEAITVVHTPRGAMSQVQAGNYNVGRVTDDTAASSSERQPTTAKLDAFLIDQNEVTVFQYNKCVAEEACPPLPEGAMTRPNLPVVNVGYGSADAFCQWAGKRLPTENEWEAAARAQGDQLYPTEEAPTCTTVNYGTGKGAECIGANPSQPESVFGRPFSGNALHTRHMAGNVWEWTSESARDQQSRIVKGGSFRSRQADLRVSARRSVKANVGADDVGFRCVKSQPHR